MSGLIASRPSWRRHLHLSYRHVLVCLLLATQALVPALLAEPGYYSWKALSEVSSVLIASGDRTGMGVRIFDGDTIVTCAHVLGDPDNILVSGIGMPEERAYLVSQNKHEDVAILRVKTRGVPFKMHWDREAPPKGTTILQGFKTSQGKPASFNQAEITDKMWSGNIVINTVPTPGYSGGPVFLAIGQLIGITRGEVTTNQGILTEIVPIWKSRDLVP